MLETAGLDANFRFLVLKVAAQIDQVEGGLDRPDADFFPRMKVRDDYIDHLKGIVENKCFSIMHSRRALSATETNSLRALNVIAANLEHIGDYAVSVARQTSHFSRPDFFQRYDYRSFFQLIRQALGMVREAYLQRDTTKALEICRAELEIDRLYTQRFERILAEMEAGGRAPDLVTSLFIFHYLERMGDALLNIGEAILSYRLGDKLKLEQYEKIRDALAAIREDESGEGTGPARFARLAETRGGSQTGLVSGSSTELGRDQDVVYKEGPLDKILGEVEGVAQFNRVAPGVAPRVIESRTDERRGAILLEYLDGRTLQQLVLENDAEWLREAVGRLEELLERIWRATRQERPARAGYVAQLRQRLDDVFIVHPQFQEPDRQIGGLRIPGFAQLASDAQRLDDQLPAPFTVLIHGDLNLDNILYNPTSQSVHLLDLHRAGPGDYLQDASVLLVSHFRLPVPPGSRRRRIRQNVSQLLGFFRQFAQREGDATWDARLALALARSLATSTRFEFNRQFAQEMIHRSAFLLRRLLAHHGPWSDFVLDEDILAY